jgi:protein-tyrosine phosphatase
VVVPRARPDVATPLRVLFVCTANIARSPYAERRTRQLLAGTALTVSSAGIPGVPGRGMDSEMAAQLRSRGAEPNGHVSRILTGDLLAATDLVLTFEFTHRLRIAAAWPDHAIKVFGVNQLRDAVDRLTAPAAGLELLDQAFAVRRPDGMNWDVADPHARGQAAAARCADEIDDALSLIIPALAGTRIEGAATGV